MTQGDLAAQVGNLVLQLWNMEVIIKDLQAEKVATQDASKGATPNEA